MNRGKEKLHNVQEKTCGTLHTVQCEGMNSMKTEYASKQLEAMTVGFTKIVNGRSVTRWSVNRWEVGTFGKSDAVNLTEALVELGFDVE